MAEYFHIDWRGLFAFEIPILEIIIRGSVIYLGLFLLLRFILKRESGTVGITDLLVVVLLADASQNALAGEYRTIPDGLLLIIVIIFWSYVLNWLGYRFPKFQRFVHPPALLLVENGKMIQRNMRREFVTEDELMSLLREQGIEDLSKVKKAYMEGSGKISVVEHEEERHNPPERKEL